MSLPSAIASFGADPRLQAAQIPHSDAKSNVFTYQEAMQIEQEAHALDLQRQKEHAERAEERRRRMGLPLGGPKRLTKEEQEARIWAFMYALVFLSCGPRPDDLRRSYKPTDSDLEDDEDSDDDDPAGWFDDDQDDGRKGQDIIEPDYDEDIANVIRIDEARIPRSIYFDGPEGE